MTASRPGAATSRWRWACPARSSTRRSWTPRPRIVEAALAAGKQVSLLHPLTDDGLARMEAWMKQGVNIMTVDSDYRVLIREYSAGLKKLRAL